MIASAPWYSGGVASTSTTLTPGDIAIANGLAGELLGRSLDELSPQTRTFLLELHRFVERGCRDSQVQRSEFRFTRRDVREVLGWTDFQIHTHLTKLTELEYLLVHRGEARPAVRLRAALPRRGTRRAAVPGRADRPGGAAKTCAYDAKF